MGLLLGLSCCKKTPASPLVASTGPTVSTVVGSSSGFADGPVASALFSAPSGVAVDAQGTLYVADYGNTRLRKVFAGQVTTFPSYYLPGTGIPVFDLIGGVAVDARGTVYVSDRGYTRNLISTVSPMGLVSTLAGNGVAGFADGTGTGVKFNAPVDVAVDGQGVVYVADSQNHRIRKIMPDGTVSTVAGTGVAEDVDGSDKVAAFDTPCGITVDGQRRIYVADLGNRIRLITP